MIAIYAVVGAGNKTKIERNQEKRVAESLRNLELRERELKVAQMEKELGI